MFQNHCQFKFLSGVVTPNRGRVMDGSISGATVKQIQNGVNVTIDTTDSQGEFRLTKVDGASADADISANAALLLPRGGTDIESGLSNTLTLKSNGSVIYTRNNCFLLLLKKQILHYP